MALVFEDRIPANERKVFIDKVRTISSKLDINPNWLMVVMGFETGYTFSPSKKNPYSTATGLIQFLESTAVSLGTTTAALAKMTRVEQLDYVYEYLRQTKKARGSFNHLVDVYLAVFYPASIDDGLDYVYPNYIYAANKGFDLDKDGKISKQEIQDKILSTVPVQQKEEVLKKKARSKH